jgi:hypothetical protein
MVPKGPIYVVESVSESRAYCVPLAGVHRKPAGDGSGGEGVVAEFDSAGRGVNISSHSFVERVGKLEADEAQRPRSGGSSSIEGAKEGTVSVAELPLLDEGRKSNREINKEMKMAAARKKADKHAGLPGTGGKRKLAGAAAASKAKGRKDRPIKTVRKCFCDCGEETMGYFAPGHDGRYHGAMRKLADGRTKPGELPKKWQDALGPFKKDGIGHRPTHDYKGGDYKAHA